MQDLGLREKEARRRTGLGSAGIDALKGWFLALVVAGHNTVLADAIPGFSDALYGFHVHAFLFLPFLFPSARFSGPWLRERAVRYLVPYTAFYAVACLLFAALYRRGDPASAVAIDVAIGWVTASTRALKDACGLKMFWFLPALLSLVLFRGVWTSSSRAARCLLMAVAIAAHGVVGALPVEVKRYTPMGLLAVVYVFPMALAAEWLWGHLRRRPRGAVAVVAFTGFAACLTLHVGLGTSSRIGSVNVYTWAEPGRLLLTTLTPIASFLAFTAVAGSLAGLPGLVALGQRSLLVYLAHSLVFQVLLVATPPGLLSNAPLATGVGLLGVTLLLSWCAAEAIERIAWLRRAVAPRGLGDWSLASRATGESARPEPSHAHPTGEDARKREDGPWLRRSVR